MKCYHCDAKNTENYGGIPLCFYCAGGKTIVDKELTQRGPETLPQLAAERYPTGLSYANHTSNTILLYGYLSA